MNDNYLQDKNAGNPGDYLKHFWLIKLADTLLRENPNSSIAYIESHAGAGKYVLQNTQWKGRDKYKELVCDEEKQWKRFNLLNPYIEHKKIYFGSFALVGRILAEAKSKSKMVLYEIDDSAFKRMKATVLEIVPELDIDDNKEPKESNIGIIKDRIRQLKSNYDIILCFIDPYWKRGKDDIVWSNLLTYDDLPLCYILVFDVQRKPHKLHCEERFLIKSVSYQIREYGIFGNTLSRNTLLNNE